MDIMAKAYRMKGLGSMAILLLVACRSAQGDAADDKRALTKLVQDLNVALAKADMDFLERALHKDFVLTNSKGTIEDRAAYLANRKTGRIQYESKKSDELRLAFCKVSFTCGYVSLYFGSSRVQRTPR